MANHKERKGVLHCGEIAEDNGWMFREQPTNDVGIDAHMEMTDETGKAQLLAMQIKSGPSYFKESKESGIIFRKITERQYNYWTMNTLPCILVLYNPDDGLCIWEKLTKKSIKRTKDGGYYVEVPINQVFLDEESNRKLLAYTNLPEHITNYNFLLSQKRFMQIIKDGGVVKLHSKEWVNKCSGRGETELIVDDGKDIKTYPYPYWFPYTPYTMVFPKLFPWADFTADEDFYEEDDKYYWQEYNCHLDKDEGWILVGEPFQEYRKGLNPMRSIDHGGEMAEYMLVLSLNNLGNAFLNVDSYVSSNQPYVEIRPESE